jgi:protein-S-isoprenylcysteine O-methyltransferase Ste14
LALVIAALWRKWRLEERWLAEAFGPAYAEYREASWALIPFIV